MRAAFCFGQNPRARRSLFFWEGTVTIWEILLLGAALSMDAVAVGLTDGMNEPQMPLYKALFVAGAFGLFQFLMPVAGYYCGYALANVVGIVAPWLSFGLLAFLGGKTIADGLSHKDGKAVLRTKRRTGAGQVILQAIATSIDALAVGVTLLAAETARGLPDHVLACAFLIGETTAALSLAALWAGKRTGDKLADRAETAGGTILLLIGVKILLQSYI